MRHFPIFLRVAGKRIVVTGGSETAMAKLRLLMKTEAEIVVFAEKPIPEIENLAGEGRISLIRRRIMGDDFYNTALVYAAEDDDAKDQITAAMGRMAGILVNIVDNLEDSQFITPALVDRDPVTVAIGTEGTAPVLARKIKADIEAVLPSELGILARVAEAFRSKATAIAPGKARRKFWSGFFFDHGPVALKHDGVPGAEQTLEKLLSDAESGTEDIGKVYFVGAGPGDPDLLTRKAASLLHEADVVVHDRLVSGQILELARREAEIVQTGKKGYGPSWKQEDINALMVKHAAAGAMVVRLKSGDPGVFGRLDEEMDALDEAGIRFEIIPGITTASAAASQMNVSLTKRRRNSALRIMTAHDIKGFAEHDWQDLARNGAVAAIYMGLRQAHFLSGRLLMHGASPDIPVTILKNVSRPDQEVTLSSLGQLPVDAEEYGSDGPVILMLGLEPRAAAVAVDNNSKLLAEIGA